MMKLLSRSAFRNAVFTRDDFKCVVCHNAAVDAHHILERRLWSDGGYYLENGASLCQEHHLLCEQTRISVEELRRRCNITKPIIPEHLYDDQKYDKWGNPVLANSLRLRGELFYDISVQKILAAGQVLDLFTKYVKYPRTYHLPWSESIGKDDRIQRVHDFDGKRVIVTLKMDGENTTFYNDHIHARSIDSDNHQSRNWVKNFWSNIAFDIPDDFRICGENLYATHSIFYPDLKSHFYGFSMWNGLTCLSWDETMEWFDLLGISPVTVVYDDIYNESAIRKCFSGTDWSTCEGYVVRIADQFNYNRFRNSVAKFVRRNHIMTAPHNWMHATNFKVNRLKETKHA